MSPWWPIGVCAVAVVGLLAAERLQSQSGIWLCKPVAASAFIGLAWILGASHFPFGRLILLALILCWLGDLLLIPHGGSWFQLGILAFLLGHVAYIMAFAMLPLHGPTMVVAGAVMALIGWTASKWLAPRFNRKELRSYLWPVRIYIVVISAMVTIALAATLGGGPFHLAVGATLFALSDVSVAKRRFIEPKYSDAVWGLPLYFLAQLVLAASVSQF